MHISYKIIAKLYTSPGCVGFHGEFVLNISGAVQKISELGIGKSAKTACLLLVKI